MKRSKLISLIIVSVFIMATVISALAFSAFATGVDEATLKVETVSYHADTGREDVPTEVSGSAKSGTFDEMLALANAATAAKSDTATTYRYTVKLNKDASMNSAIEIAPGANVEIFVDLAGYTLEDAVATQNITVTGATKLFRIMGNYTEDGKPGKILKTAAGSILELLTSDAVVRIEKVAIEYAQVLTGQSPVFSASAGLMKIEDTSFVTNEDTALSFAKATGGATIEIKRSDIAVTHAGDTAVYADGGKVLIASTKINAAGAAVIAKGASSIVTVDSDITAAGPFSLVANDTTTVYVLGGTTTTTSGSLGTNISTTNLFFYYGTGNTTVKGADPASAGIDSSGKFVFTYYDSIGAYVIGPRFTPERSSESTATVVTLGQAPVVTRSKINTTLTTLFTKPTSSTDTTVQILALNKDATTSATYSRSVVTYDDNANLYLNTNGYKLTIQGDTVQARNVFPYNGGVSVTFDGRSAVPVDNGSGGVTYNRGSISYTGYSGMLIFTRQHSSATGKRINRYTVTTVKNLDVNYAQSAPSSDGFVSLSSGDARVENVKITFSPELLTTATSANMPLLKLSSGTNLDNHAFVKNSEFTVDYTKLPVSLTAADVKMASISVGGGSKFFIEDVRAEGGSSAISSVGDVGYISDSSLSANVAIFVGGGKPKVYDSTLSNTANGTIGSSSSPIIYFGTGKTTIAGCETGIVGTYTLEEGYQLSKSLADGLYRLKLGTGAVPTISMPAIFSSGMVLQRNEPINIYGYCSIEDTNINVTFNGVTKGTASASRVSESETLFRFEVTFDPHEAAWDKTITIEAEGALGATVIENVAIGEVWVVSGQSNASLETGYLDDLDEYKRMAELYTNIRFYASNVSPAAVPEKLGTANTPWTTKTPDISKTKFFSAVGYVAAVNLAAEFGPDVPIGMIKLARGSVKMATFLNYENAVSLLGKTKVDSDLATAATTIAGGGTAATNTATGMYNRMFAPLDGYTAAGMIWYQGEGDVPGKYLGGHTYTEAFDLFHEQCRDIFSNENFPIFMIEIAPYSRESDNAGLPNFRNEQYDICKGKDRYLVSTATDGFVGSSQDWAASKFIHPAAKSVIGLRCANLILDKVYGISGYVPSQFPMYESSRLLDNGKLELTFDTNLAYFSGSSASGFEVWNGFSWITVSGEISGNKIILETSSFSNITKVRYGYGNVVLAFADGSELAITGYTEPNDNSISVTVEGTGETITITKDDGSLLCSKNPGNITNGSGIPMAAFQVTIG